MTVAIPGSLGSKGLKPLVPTTDFVTLTQSIKAAALVGWVEARNPTTASVMRIELGFASLNPTYWYGKLKLLGYQRLETKQIRHGNV
jgi:hypothetical protein